MGLQLDLKTLFNPKDKEQIISWLQAVRPTSSRLWGKVVPAPDGSLSDGFRMCMDQKPVNAARLSYPGSEVGCPLGPIPWPKGFKTVPELDRKVSGTQPEEFHSDVRELGNLVDRFTRRPGTFQWPAPSPIIERGGFPSGLLSSSAK